jgi:hypothetical protein
MGAFRKKDYSPKISGVEYRSLSNFWSSSPRLAEWAYDGVVNAFYLINYQMNEKSLAKIGDRIKKITSLEDRARVQEIQALLIDFGLGHRLIEQV